MKKYQLRKYQEESVQKCLDYINDPKDNKPGLIVIPTGGGKSLIISELAMRIGEPILSIQPSKELLEQNYKKLVEFGGTATLYSASVGKKEASVLTFATLGSIVDVAEEFKALGVRIVICDEAHFKLNPSPTSMFSKFMKALAPKKVVGLTATPVFLKASMEGAELKFLTRMRPNYFKQVLHCVQIQELVRDGFWSKLKYELHPFDDSSLQYNSNGSDFTEESIKKAAKQNDVNNKILKRIRKLREEGCKKVVVFMDSIANVEIMAKHVPGSVFVHSKQSKKERESALRMFDSGESDVIINKSILQIGWDSPEIDVIIMGDATNSLARYYQILGRGVRIHPNKKFCLNIDFMGNIDRFGRIEDLEIINNENHGWGIYNKDVLLTNVPMAGRKVTKKMLSDKAQGIADDYDGMMPFGKYKGQKIGEMPLWYLKFIIGPESTVKWNYDPISRRIKQEIEKLLEEQNKMSFIQK